MNEEFLAGYLEKRKQELTEMYEIEERFRSGDLMGDEWKELIKERKILRQKVIEQAKRKKKKKQGTFGLMPWYVY